VSPGHLDAKVSAGGNLDDVALQLYVIIPTHGAPPFCESNDVVQKYARNRP
jgi:hypothetical protein